MDASHRYPGTPVPASPVTSALEDTSDGLGAASACRHPHTTLPLQALYLQHTLHFSFTHLHAVLVSPRHLAEVSNKTPNRPHTFNKCIRKPTPFHTRFFLPKHPSICPKQKCPNPASQQPQSGRAASPPPPPTAQSPSGGPEFRVPFCAALPATASLFCSETISDASASSLPLLHDYAHLHLNSSDERQLNQLHIHVHFPTPVFPKIHHHPLSPPQLLLFPR